VKGGEGELVEKGILKALLHTRVLNPDSTHSTASHRGFGASPSNLLFRVDKPMTADQLKAEFIRIVQQNARILRKSAIVKPLISRFRTGSSWPSRKLCRPPEGVALEACHYRLSFSGPSGWTTFQ
jgi:hypothetical protein